MVVTHFMKKVFAIILISLSCSMVAFGTHIVGGRIFYECVTGNTFKITLKIYRDCNTGEADFDEPAHVGIYNRTDNTLHDVIEIYNPKITKVPPVINDPCLDIPPDICVEEGIYTATIALPPSNKGYTLVYQRCCRNRTVVNLKNPMEQGATYYTTISSVGNGSCNNSSPEFIEWPPIALCANKEFVFDHSASDPDGDSLAYQFCAPLKGASPSDPLLQTPDGPPYEMVDYDASRGFSAANPLYANPKLAIDPETGIIKGIPTVEGQYVVGVCVMEFKNGKLVGEGFRDFQFNVTDCWKKVNAIIQLPPSDTAIRNCDNFTVSFRNLSTGTDRFFWDFGVPGTDADTSREVHPTFTFPDTGTYRVKLVGEPNGICSDTDQVTVKIYPSLNADFSVLSTCPDDSLPLKDLSKNTYGPIEQWKWDFGDGNNSTAQHPVHDYEKGGTYTITLEVTNEHGCTDEAVHNVGIFPKPRSRFEVQQPCLHQPLNIEYRSSIDSGKIIASIWDFGNGHRDSVQVPAYTFDDPGTYTIELVEMSNKGCADTFRHEVEVRPVTTAQVTSDTAICATYPIRLFASGGYYYRWEPPGDYHQNISNPYVHPESTTTYTVFVSDGCYEDSAEVTVTTLPLPYLRVSNDTTITKGQHARLWANTSGTNVEWSPKATLESPFSEKTIAKPEKSTTYEVKAMGENGCIKKGNVFVKVVPDCAHLYVPNAFTPNSDGRNDYFYPKNFGDARMLEFRIYSRWGQMVYQSNSPEGGWNGEYNGQPAPGGTYVYSIRVECAGEQRILKGNLHLIR